MGCSARRASRLTMFWSTSEMACRSRTAPPWNLSVLVLGGMTRRLTGPLTFGNEAVGDLPPEASAQAVRADCLRERNWIEDRVPKARCKRGDFLQHGAIRRPMFDVANGQ